MCVVLCARTPARWCVRVCNGLFIAFFYGRTRELAYPFGYFVYNYADLENLRHVWTKPLGHPRNKPASSPPVRLHTRRATLTLTLLRQCCVPGPPNLLLSDTLREPGHLFLCCAPPLPTWCPSSITPSFLWLWKLRSFSSSKPPPQNKICSLKWKSSRKTIYYWLACYRRL